MVRMTTGNQFRIPEDLAEMAELFRTMLANSPFLPSPEESQPWLVNQWEPLLAPGVTEIDAELAGYEYLGDFRRHLADGDDLGEVLTTLVTDVHDHGGPAALAMLRVLAVTATPPRVRAAADAAADRLASTGLAEPVWTKRIGAPKLGLCFGYEDSLGAQEAVVLTFSYRRRRHSVSVFIDHGLGGGVKDCWVGDQPNQLRADYQRIAERHGLEFGDYHPGLARSILERALDRPPCPVELDQVEDVHNNLDLLRQRVRLLPEPSGEEAAPPARPPAGRPTVHRLKVTLRRTKPPIWRRLEVPSDVTLADLHTAIQRAFGWGDCHLWVFETSYGEYGNPDPELGHGDAGAMTLADVATEVGDRFRYTYDFGDDWQHDVLVEAVDQAQPGLAYPRCLTGRRTCPPDDCGGVWGYEELLSALADPGHPEHHDQVTWLGLASADEFDPAAFDLERANRRLPARVLLPS
jgi:hypothetical protein